MSTCVRAGERNEATITFLSRAEFDQSFHAKLETLGIPNAHQVSLGTVNKASLTDERFDALLEQCDPQTVQAYKDVPEDVRELIRHRRELLELVGQPPRHVSGDELLA